MDSLSLSIVDSLDEIILRAKNSTFFCNRRQPIIVLHNSIFAASRQLFCKYQRICEGQCVILQWICRCGRWQIKTFFAENVCKPSSGCALQLFSFTSSSKINPLLTIQLPTNRCASFLKWLIASCCPAISVKSIKIIQIVFIPGVTGWRKSGSFL